MIAKALFVLPYSSVSVERAFSNLKNIVNAKRNRLTIENVEACLLGYQESRSELLCINQEMIGNYINAETSTEKLTVQSEENVAERRQLDEKSDEISPIRQEQPFDSESDNEEIHESFLLVRRVQSSSNKLKRTLSIPEESGVKRAKIDER